MSTVVIGMDPHKRSATVEVMAGDEAVLGRGRYATDAAGYRSMLAEARRWPERIWAIEGCQGIGRHIASRLLADGERVVDVPPKLSARTRVFATGPRDRRHRCALGRAGRYPHGRAAPGSRRPAADGAADPG
jgi:hypothetical protein